MTKILMIYPPVGYFTDYNTPTGTLYVATYLQEKGHDVKFIDCSIEENFYQKVMGEVKTASCLGSYCMSIHVKHLVPLLIDVKKANPNIKIILGGPHPTLFPEQTAEDDLIDFVVRGEGEETMLELVDAIEKGAADFSGIKGITYKQDGKIISTPQRDFIDMDTLPFIDWSLMSQKALDSMKEKIARVQATRGCPFKCSFCLNVVTNNRKMRYKSPSKVVDEIEHMVKNYGVKRIGFRDEVFLTKREHSRAIAEEIIRRNIKITWLGNPHTRFLREAWIDDGFLDTLSKSGCNKLQCGGESGSQRILDMLHKTQTPEDILNFVKRCKEHNIVPLVAFMSGIPSETKEEQLQTLKLIWQILEINPQTFINGPAMFRPYPGGELYDRCVVEYGLEMPKTFKDWAQAETVGGSKPPWVEEIYFTQNLWTHVMFARLEKLGQLWGICGKIAKKYSYAHAVAAYIFGKIAYYRLKHCYYKYPVDFWLLHVYWKIKGEVPELS